MHNKRRKDSNTGLDWAGTLQQIKGCKLQGEKSLYSYQDLNYSMSCGGGPQGTLFWGETYNYSGHVTRQRNWKLADSTALIFSGCKICSFSTVWKKS